MSPNNTGIAPNGVRQISKRQWTLEEYRQWFEGLRTTVTPANALEDFYEIVHTGKLNYEVTGNGEKYMADGISFCDGQRKQSISAKIRES